MDFDEYEYLERTVENPAIGTEKDGRLDRGGGDGGAGETKSSRRSRSEEPNRVKEERDFRERSSRRDKDHNRSGRDDERAHSKDRDYRSLSRGYREKDLEKERERSRRSSSGSSRHERDDERERRRARSRERAARERELEREMLERERRRFKEKKELMEPEADPERDQRTVFAFQMPLKATERDVYEFFSQVGKVRDVRLIMDRNSRRSKGVGYIEFYDVMSVPQAIALSGHLLLGQPVMVKPSEAEKNLVQSNAAAGSGLVGAATDRKLYVGNLHYNMTEFHLRQIFEAFGPVELVQLPLEPDTGHCKGYGFIQFAELEHAKAARSLHGTLDIAGRTIKVSAVTDHISGQNAAGTNAADFDDEEGGGLSLNARSRAILMQKLDRTGTATSIAESLGIPGLSNGAVVNQQISSLSVTGLAAVSPAINALRPLSINEPSVEASECLLFKNMFDPTIEADPEFDLDIKEEVEEECSKFGPVRHIFVDKNSSGFVYLRFESVATAASCQRAMDKRWYAGRLISVSFMQPQEYEARFGSNV